MLSPTEVVQVLHEVSVLLAWVRLQFGAPMETSEKIFPTNKNSVYIVEYINILVVSNIC